LFSLAFRREEAKREASGFDLVLSGHSTTGNEAERSQSHHTFLRWSHNSTLAPTETPTTYHPEEKAPEAFGQECP